MAVKPELRVENFENMAFGMFVHWGLYSIKESGEWAMEIHNISSDSMKNMQMNLMLKIIIQEI